MARRNYTLSTHTQPQTDIKTAIKEDIQACLVYAYRVVAHERIEPALATE
jgi:hypothetical protein